MVFPTTPLDVEIDLFISGAWTDITSDVYISDKIVITRGRADEAARVDPGKCTMVLNNRLGKYSPRNPLSPYYGLIGRNTPLRVLVRAGTPFLDLAGTSGSYASTPDAAALDITGDLDVRVDAVLTNWLDASDGLRTTALASKMGSASSDKSWFFGIRSNRLYFEWSADGTSVLGASSTVQPSIPPSGRLAVRATIDVNNGSGGRTITFYTSRTGLAGTWTQLGAPVVQSGVTSIFNSAAAVRVGAPTFVTTYPTGRIHGVEIRNGIGGSAAANPDFTAQAVGTTTFADAAGRTWTLNSPAAITNRRSRFIGEVSSWPSRWDVSGKDVRVPIEAAGILRRLGQGAKPLQSTLRRKIPGVPNLLAYWPMEDGRNASQAASPVAGVRPLALAPANWASVDSLASSEALPAISSATSTPCVLNGSVPKVSGLSSWLVQYVYRLDTVNATVRTFLNIHSTGTVAEWYIQMGTGIARVRGTDADGTQIFQTDTAIGTDLWGQWIAVQFQVQQNGGNVEWQIVWTDVGGDAGAGADVFAGTVGAPLGVASPSGGYSADIDGLALGHISVWRSWDATTSAAYDGAIDAWAGETAGTRMTRLAAEEGVPLSQWGDPTQQERVGPQLPAVLLDLLEDAAAVDGGILGERRNTVALSYRDRISLYNQPVALALDYTTSGHIAPPLEPIDDDQKVRNDVTVTRDGGASGRSVLATGPLSTQDPPAGVGLYDEAVTLNLYSDDQAAQHAGWRLHLGTVDEARYPVLNLDLAAAPSLIDAVTLLESGDRVQIANLPSWLPPGGADLIMQGYQETIGHPIDWDFQLNCTPASPWTVAVADSVTLGTAETDSTVLASGVNSSVTSLPVTVAAGLAWTTTPAQYPFNLMVDGEEMTATACSGAGPSQTFTVVRSVNGISKAHLAGVSVSLADPAVAAL